MQYVNYHGNTTVLYIHLYIEDLYIYISKSNPNSVYFNKQFSYAMLFVDTTCFIIIIFVYNFSNQVLYNERMK